MPVSRLNLRYMTTFSEQVTYINNAFNKAIAKGNKLSKIDKEIFNLTLDFTSKDYLAYRTKEYWEELDAIQGEINKKTYVLTAVKEYLRGVRSIT